jgi:2,3-bisphosphoglycerate-dependent phosphoglycerate mutase
MSRRWPDHLWIVRHGQSAGNVQRDHADAAGLAFIDIAERDMDVPLSELGEEQARALGTWFAGLPEAERPTTVLTSPYVRAMQTASRVCEAGGVHTSAVQHVDERLREREFGILDRLTGLGITERFPEQAETRSRVGKFYHRPPGGESWCDVILRLRSLLDTISLHHAQPGSRVLIVAHQVVVLCLRYLLENMTEADVLAIDRTGDVINCGVTEYRLQPDDPHGLRSSPCLELVHYNLSVPLRDEGAPVTARADVPAAPR